MQSAGAALGPGSELLPPTGRTRQAGLCSGLSGRAGHRGRGQGGGLALQRCWCEGLLMILTLGAGMVILFAKAGWRVVLSTSFWCGAWVPTRATHRLVILLQ